MKTKFSRSSLNFLITASVKIFQIYTSYAQNENNIQ